MNLTIGSLAPTRGEVRVFGATPRAARGSIGYVPQRIELDPDLPLRARDFVALGVDGARFGVPLPNARRRARVDEALDDVGARAFAGEPVGRLSGGEQQRLAMAQAIVGRPRLLLLDETAREPRSERRGRDRRRHGAQSRASAASRCCSSRTTSIRSSADLDRVLYLADGRAAIGTVADVINEDTLSRLYDRPVDVPARARGASSSSRGTARERVLREPERGMPRSSRARSSPRYPPAIGYFVVLRGALVRGDTP